MQMLQSIALAIALQTVSGDDDWQVNHLRGRSGTLRPDVNLDQVIWQDNKVRDYVNSNQLSIIFDHAQTEKKNFKLSD